MPTTFQDVNDKVLLSAEEQIKELQPILGKQVEIADILAKLTRLRTLLDGNHSYPLDASINNLLQNPPPATPIGIIDLIETIQKGSTTLSDLGRVLVGLYTLQQLLEEKIQKWINDQTIKKADGGKLQDILLNVINRVRQLLNYRPDVGAIMDDLQAIKNLRGGPADAVAFHDFHVLQMAFKSVWMHAFDWNLKSAAAKLYEETVRLYDEAGITFPPIDAIDDINQLQEFKNAVERDLTQNVTESIPLEVTEAFPVVSSTIWNLLSGGQRFVTYLSALFILDANNPEDQKEKYRKTVGDIFKSPDGPSGRISKMIYELGRALNEPYAFDVFAPDSFNYGLLITYRQKWEPGEYQAGDLVATIPLAPGETRKFSKKRVVKTTMSKKMMEKSMSFRSLQSSEISRAEQEIMEKTTTATNFKMTTSGSFDIGIGSIGVTSEFGGNSAAESAKNKKDFHEATIKAAEEYRLERSMEIDTSTSVETEETSSGEISNPNNEITVTYLFYELQRRYKIHEFLYRVRPVIMVAQDVPAPHEIDEAWLIQYQWIIARVLLDDSLRPALDYLTSGFAGDEVSIEVIKASWQKQADLIKKLEGQVTNQLILRDSLRSEILKKNIEQADVATMEVPLYAKILSFGAATMLDPASDEADKLKARIEAAKTNLGYVEGALADAQNKLRQHTSAFEQATKEYSSAMQNQFARHTSIDQLRIHVKQNILYYMQAIWAHEPPDQRFFRLYNKKVFCPKTQANCPNTLTLLQTLAVNIVGVEVKNICVPGIGGGSLGGDEHELIDVADIDNPLGYKGNYIIFALKDDCDLTDYMKTAYFDEYLGAIDPDGSDDFDAESFDEQWKTAKEKVNQPAELDNLRKKLEIYVERVRRSTDEIIVPTGQLFIEALPGSHPLLEDFKLLHRFEDVRKVKAEVRHAELENLRLASRLATAQNNKSELLEDPDIEKKIVVEGNATVVVDSNL